MPKKKLTKAQVKKKLLTIHHYFADLSTDKLYHKDSFVPISPMRMVEWVNKLHRARSRIK